MLISIQDILLQIPDFDFPVALSLMKSKLQSYHRCHTELKNPDTT